MDKESKNPFDQKITPPPTKKKSQSDSVGFFNVGLNLLTLAMFLVVLGLATKVVCALFLFGWRLL